MIGDFVIRPATRGDAADLAILDDIAGHGFSAWRWGLAVKQGLAENAFAHGRSIMMRHDEVFGYTNCRIAESEHLVAGMATSYAMPAFAPDPNPPQPLAPVQTLMVMARGSWFVDALAVYPEYRRRRFAVQLLEDCFSRARIEDDATEINLIVRSDNQAAMALYKSFGFAVVTRKPFVDFQGGRAQGRDYILMSAAL